MAQTKHTRQRTLGPSPTHNPDTTMAQTSSNDNGILQNICKKLGNLVNKSEEVMYKGIWKNNKPHDPNGMLSWPCGTVYKGNFVKGIRAGHGVMLWPTGHKYVGNWEKGKRHGDGDFFEPGGKVYTGRWDQDKPNGKGRLFYPDGTKFVGEFHNGFFVFGECQLPDGSKQIGEWAKMGSEAKNTLEASSVLKKGKWLQPDGSFERIMEKQQAPRNRGRF